MSKVQTSMYSILPSISFFPTFLSVTPKNQAFQLLSCKEILKTPVQVQNVCCLANKQTKTPSALVSVKYGTTLLMPRLHVGGVGCVCVCVCVWGGGGGGLGLKESFEQFQRLVHLISSKISALFPFTSSAMTYHASCTLVVSRARCSKHW